MIKTLNLFIYTLTRVSILLFVLSACNNGIEINNTNRNINMEFNEKDSMSLDLSNQFLSPSFVDTVMYINGKTKEVNGLKCYVQYKVLADSGNRDSNLYVSIDKAFLITPKQRVPLNHYNFWRTDKNINITSLTKHFRSFSDLKDKNKDGYLDVEVMTEQAHNCYFDVFIFNPKNKLFEFSKIFSGFECDYDKKLRRVSSLYSGGAAFHISEYINLEKDEKTVAFVETIRMDGGTFSYKKTIGKKVIEEKRKIMSNHPHEYFDEQEWLERGSE